MEIHSFKRDAREDVLYLFKNTDLLKMHLFQVAILARSLSFLDDFKLIFGGNEKLHV